MELEHTYILFFKEMLAPNIGIQNSLQGWCVIACDLRGWSVQKAYEGKCTYFLLHVKN